MDGECVSWLRYRYVELKGVETSDGTPKKRLSIVTEKTPPGKLIEYFMQLLQEYPFHQFMACWQCNQCDQIKEFLTQNHVLCVHDFSENYECTLQDEVQTQNFCRGEVSVHVTTLYRHSVLEYDGIQSIVDSPVIIKEHVFTILDDLSRDSYVIQHRRNLKQLFD